MRTKYELTKYYQNEDYFNKAGYKSKYYGLTYYDGYGYNYYTGAYGYYEYSRPPIDSTGPLWKVDKFFIVFSICLAILICFTGGYWYNLETE